MQEPLLNCPLCNGNGYFLGKDEDEGEKIACICTHLTGSDELRCDTIEAFMHVVRQLVRSSASRLYVHGELRKFVNFIRYKNSI